MRNGSLIVCLAVISAFSAACGKQTAQSGDWTMYGGTQDDHRYSPLSQIDEQTVGKLGLAWSHESPPHAVSKPRRSYRTG